MNWDEDESASTWFIQCLVIHFTWLKWHSLNSVDRWCRCRKELSSFPFHWGEIENSRDVVHSYINVLTTLCIDFPLCHKVSRLPFYQTANRASRRKNFHFFRYSIFVTTIRTSSIQLYVSNNSILADNTNNLKTFKEKEAWKWKQVFKNRRVKDHK